MKQPFAKVDPEAAYDVAGFIARHIDKAGSETMKVKWQEVSDALFALSNDTDFIVTDPDLVPDA